MSSVHINFAVALGLVLLLALAASGASAFYYRTTVPPVAAGRRAVLVVLRALGIGSIILLLCEPVLSLRFITVAHPVLAVIADDSKSMTIVDRAGDRAAELHAALRDPVFSRLAERADIRYYTFGVRLRPWPHPGADTLALNEGATDIAGALHGLGEEAGRHPIDAALLLSDGAYTLGRDPVHEAENLSFPLFTMGIGDSSEQKDLLIRRTAANELVYAGTRSPVSVTVKTSGFDGEHVEVSLSEGNRLLDRVPLTLGQGTREYTVDLSYVPEGEGTRRYTAAVTALPGELTTANNHRSFTARVLRSKLRILFLAGEASPDVPVIVQTLKEEKNFTVNSFTATNRGGFYEGAIPRALLDSADCIILAGFPTVSTPANLLQQIVGRVSAGGIPVFFIAGPAFDFARAQVLGEVLPFTLSQSPGSEQMVSMRPREDQREHPILGTSDGIAAWTELPPVYRRSAAYGAKPGSVVLGTAQMQNSVQSEPLLVARSVNRLKSVALLAYGVWRWRLMSQDAPATATLFSSLLVNTVKWLTTPEDKRPVHVIPSQEAFSQGQPVEFTGQVYDQEARPVENAALKVVAQQHDLIFETDLRPLGGGRYEGSMEGVPEGEYLFRAPAMLNGVKLGEDGGRFSVGEMDLEFQDTRMNSSLLRQLAYRTGGNYIGPGGLGALDSILSTRPAFAGRTVVHASELELWHWQWLLAALIALFAGEWILRKISGML